MKEPLKTTITDHTLPQRHTLDKAVELWRDDAGRICLLCEKCDRVTHDGDPWCCHWAHLMFDSYFAGSVAA